MPSASNVPPWDVHRLPRAEGRTVLVTGGNAGIGYFVAEQLAGTGAVVVLGSRNPVRAEAAVRAVRSRVPDARLRTVRLDLADPSSLRASVEALGLERLDAVVHNAGVALDRPPRQETRAGDELMFGAACRRAASVFVSAVRSMTERPRACWGQSACAGSAGAAAAAAAPECLCRHDEGRDSRAGERRRN
ncbi:SDR family NAD(P)-dependent oxidoreductase [Streptomyces diacarni]|uniref:SDR family NAD(P)-dependent oxidoreductase n=1 Tax=Streptomyces diacarni TaxID=2800381 RepID=A0A367FH18_9ACTN|nr:SDR family NAD(P)-dependent oxidoreductase [Streptomyces diacarni]RCG29209.1 SDR family NAD(P)-dependent oxidoreductase [Streptomyces diacarni]